MKLSQLHFDSQKLYENKNQQSIRNSGKKTDFLYFPY